MACRQVEDYPASASPSPAKALQVVKMALLAHIPKTYSKLVAVSLTTNFKEAVRVQKFETPSPKSGELLVKARYAGINASDVNLTAGRYTPGIQPPFDTGMEGIGEVVQVGADCSDYKPGDSVGYMTAGAFGEYLILPSKFAIPLPKIDPGFVPLMVSGLTASISLDTFGELKSGENVLVTAAAGGTGQFAVQLAKIAGCHVIGTCSSDEKVEFLKSIGCDRPINYKKEDLKAVLKKEYPKGVDVVYESIGGDMFDTCLKNLSTFGRLIIIGFISSYKGNSFAPPIKAPLQSILLSKSACVRGFFLFNHIKEVPMHFAKLAQLYMTGKLISTIDLGKGHSSGPFRGMQGILDGVDYLYSSKNAGKVVVEVNGQDGDSKL